MEDLKVKAKKLSEDFLANEKEYMINLKTTNKKLIDRATRIISDLCNIAYQSANYELFLRKLMLEEKGSNESQVKFTIDRLKRS